MDSVLALVTFLISLSFASSAITNTGVEIPTYSETCKRNSPDFNECLKRSLQTLFLKISKTGISELGLDSLDPLYIPRMLFNYDSLPDIGGKLVLSNSSSKGMALTKITRISCTLEEGKPFTLDVGFLIPRLIIDGQFRINGRVGKFPVTGKGPYNVTADNIKGAWKIRGRYIQLKNESHIEIRKFGVRPSVSKVKFHAGNIVEGNPRLSQIVVQFMNRFWSLFYYQTMPYIEKNFDVIAVGLLNKVFLKIPLNQLFPED